MEVNAKVLNHEGNELTMEVTAAAADLEQAIAVTLRKAAKEVKIPGFRPGKVPAKLLEGYIGEHALLQEALDEMLQPLYVEAVSQTEIFPVDRPHVEVVQLKRGDEVKVNIKVTVKPEVELGQYKGIEVT